MLDPALQAGQRLLHPMFIGGGMVQGVINITNSIIQQGKNIGGGQFFPMRTESGDVAGEGMVETQQAKSGLALGAIRARFSRQIRDHGGQFGITVVGITAGDTIGQTVVAALVILLQNGIQITAVCVHRPVQDARQIAKFPVRPDEADRRPGDGAADQGINNAR